MPEVGTYRMLDLGCGIGRHVMYCHDMGLESYGVDLSDSAIAFAIEWASSRGLSELIPRIKQSDACSLPWEDGFFEFAVSHGVLDSMPFELARTVITELGRVVAPSGIFYCDLISGDDSLHAREFTGEEIVTAAHESGTMQSYFNMSSIKALFNGLFDILECNLIRREDVIEGGYTSRYHLVLQRL